MSSESWRLLSRQVHFYTADSLGEPHRQPTLFHAIARALADSAGSVLVHEALALTDEHQRTLGAITLQASLLGPGVPILFECDSRTETLTPESSARLAAFLALFPDGHTRHTP